MASPFQEQVRRRKLFYLVLILVLFTTSWLWRSLAIEPLAVAMAIRQENRGDVELLGSVVRLSLTGSRGLVTCFLWSEAIDKQKKNEWNKLEVLVKSLTKLQPYFITPWQFQSWNLSYNVSVESDRIRDKYFYVSRGIELLGEGERINRNHPDLRWAIGFYHQHKIAQSDETNYLRSLLQLSLIAPNERDPARFWLQTPEGPIFNYEEFEKFTKDHPQLIRRLREGMFRDNETEKKRLFKCESPEDVVAFLKDNYDVPSIYRVDPLPDVPPQSRIWRADANDSLMPYESRFPLLPLAWQGSYSEGAINADVPLGDAIDAFAVSHSWFSFAQEPLPEPDALPGSSKPITDRSRQRRPKHMTTLIFRNYPAQGKRYIAERFQQEGWFLDEGWLCVDWFKDNADSGPPNRSLRVGTGKKWSLDAWQEAFAAWAASGDRNKLLLTPTEEQNKKELADRFNKRYGLSGGAPPELAVESMTAEDQREYQAAQYMFEYNFYRQVSNFPHHYNRCFVERNETTVMCRKLFFDADMLKMQGSETQALQAYRKPIKTNIEGWGERSPLEAWRDLVLLKNESFRRDNFIMEQNAEIHFRYLRLFNRLDGKTMKDELVKAARVVPMLPKFSNDEFRPPLILSPFDVDDAEGQPLITEQNKDTAADRLRMPRKKPQEPQPPMTDGDAVRPTGDPRKDKRPMPVPMQKQ
jgi:hypothetical protein